MATSLIIQNSSPLMMFNWHVVAGAYLASLCDLGEHDHGGKTMLPDHPPEVPDCVGHRTLSSDVGIGAVVTLQQRERVNR